MFCLEADSEIVQEFLSPHVMHLHAILQMSFTHFLTAKENGNILVLNANYFINSQEGSLGFLH